MEDIITRLTDKNDNAAYAATKQIAYESEMSAIHYADLSLFASLLTHEKSYIRARGCILCCSQAKWDHTGKLQTIMPRLLALLHDEKPTIIRQTLNALQEVAVFRPELHGEIRDALDSIDLAQFKPSMMPLIQKDIAALREVLND